MSKFLIGERIYLRALEKDDIVQCMKWINDPEIRCLTAFDERPFNKIKEEEWFEKMNKNKNVILFAICLDDANFIGNIGITLLSGNALLGIMIGEKEYLGRGYGTEAIKLVLDYCFNTLNLHRVALGVFEFNERAIKCYEKVGFKREGIAREVVYKKGRYWDDIKMGILKQEWSK